MPNGQDTAKLSDYPVPPIGELRKPARMSVVTTVRNGEETLARAIDSVRLQNIPDLEYIIIDSASTDNTLDIVRGNTDVVTYWQSEPDRGISDGFNKGIVLSSGEFITLLNADDWLSPGQIAAGIETLDRTGADFVFGDLLYHGKDGELLYKVTGDAAYAARIDSLMPALNHPTVIVRRMVYERFGLFDLNYRYAMDYELLLRFHCAGCKGVYNPRIVGHMTLTGASDASSLKAIREVRTAAIAYGYPIIPAYLLSYLRMAKDRIRRLIEHLLPRSLSLALRSAVNRDLARAK
ncbi:MAG TPA: glycosyltransferase family 2 protein [Rhizomicrobium sp.]|jgi:glycosyltransferase involved in cell wall biosynthesis|nr:glycosyltransferase family 2 protein [Rhizomicrobium sp.]